MPRLRPLLLPPLAVALLLIATFLLSSSTPHLNAGADGADGADFILWNATLAPLPGTGSTASATAELRIGSSGQDGVSITAEDDWETPVAAIQFYDPLPAGQLLGAVPCESGCQDATLVFDIDVSMLGGQEFLMLLDAGDLFLLVTTDAFPDGEIGGFLFKAPDGGAFQDITVGLGSGFQTFGWCGGPLRSREFLNLYPVITRVLGFDTATNQFQADSLVIPESAGTGFDIEPGDGLFVFLRQPTTLLLPSVQMAREAAFVEGPNLLAHCGSGPTDSDEVLNFNPDIDSLFVFIPDDFPVLFRHDSLRLPDSVRDIFPLTPGDAFFARATAPGIFADGFESGDTTARAR